MEIFAHRGFYGCTDIGQEILREPDVKAEALKNMPPENSEESIRIAFEKGFSIETDIVMSEDRRLIATHTNDLTLHTIEAQKGDYASQMPYEKIVRMQTGMGGRTAPFLDYSKLVDMLGQYPDLKANVEIKGAIDFRENFLTELTNPSIAERLIEDTPDELWGRIIWSSFSISHLIELAKLKKEAETAMLFYPKGIEETKIYIDKPDLFLQFSKKNLEMLEKELPMLEAVHPCIDSLNDEVIEFCLERNWTIRVWSLFERNPAKNEKAKSSVLEIIKWQKKYPKAKFDIITDFAAEVKKIITGEADEF